MVFFWLLMALLAGLLLAGLGYALRRYEREGAAAAFEERQALRAEIEALRARVEALEAIAAEAPLPQGEAPERLAPPTSTNAGAVSSAHRDGP